MVTVKMDMLENVFTDENISANGVQFLPQGSVGKERKQREENEELADQPLGVDCGCYQGYQNTQDRNCLRLCSDSADLCTEVRLV